MASYWFKNAVVYCIDVDTFKDGNGDGSGDFVGLREGLSYLAGLGVSCIWLLPFYPSPDRTTGTTLPIISGFIPPLAIWAISLRSWTKLRTVGSESLSTWWLAILLINVHGSRPLRHGIHTILTITFGGNQRQEFGNGVA
jgi:hypothetical protein